MIKSGTIIDLTEEEVWLATEIGQRRNQNTLALVGPGNKKDQRRDDAEINIEGVAAELAFCKLFNVYPDICSTLKPRNFDCILNDETVDVKSNRWAMNPFLLTPAKTPPGKTEIYALLVGLRPRYKFAGWLKEAELLQEGNLTVFRGYSDKEATYAVHADKIHPALEENSWCKDVCMLTEGQSVLCEVMVPCPRYGKNKGAK